MNREDKILKLIKITTFPEDKASFILSGFAKTLSIEKCESLEERQKAVDKIVNKLEDTVLDDSFYEQFVEKFDKTISEDTIDKALEFYQSEEIRNYFDKIVPVHSLVFSLVQNMVKEELK